MGRKEERIAAVTGEFQGQELDPRYLGFFKCFNRQLYYEAHEVLEDLWLMERRGPRGLFYQGLIQVAGAFVHVQRNRPGPAAALLRLARANLQGYPPVYEGLEITAVLALADEWLNRLAQPDAPALSPAHLPMINLGSGAA